MPDKRETPVQPRLPDTVARPFRPRSDEAPDVPCLIVLTGESRGTVVELPRGRSLVGRDPDALLCLQDEGVSRRHAAFEHPEQGVVFISDLDSTNGTYLNGAPVERQAVHDGDRIQVGSAVTLRFGYRSHHELGKADRPAPADPADLPLSPRELEVARLAADALSNEEIGARLHISPRTVKTHLRNVYQRLDLHSRLELTRYLMKHGLLEPPGR